MKKNLVFILLAVIVLAGFFLYYQKGKLTSLPVLNKEKILQPKGQSSETETKTSKKTVVEEKEANVSQGLSLELTSPADKSVVNTSTITVSGKTGANADIFVNEKETKSDSSGVFSISYELFEGENEIYVAVNDDAGNYAEKSITVYLETTE